MKNKIKIQYPLVGFIPTEEYIEDLEKRGFEYVESNDTSMCAYFKHTDGSRLKYYYRSKIFDHTYKFDRYKDLSRKIYDLYHIFKSNNLKPLIFFRRKKGRYPISYKTRMGKIRPSLLEIGNFLYNFNSKKSFAMCVIYKEDDYYFLSTHIHTKK